MRDRIKELALQAGMTRILDEHASEYGNGMFENTPYPELEKFAQLIVEECARLVDQDWHVSGAELKEHFGVDSSVE